jgi:hypothetical protein
VRNKHRLRGLVERSYSSDETPLALSSKEMLCRNPIPERGNYAEELISLGIREFRQTVFKPYRVICRIQQSRAVII